MFPFNYVFIERKRERDGRKGRTKLGRLLKR